jgi:pimeloyl-ACP methyl ester carboxylesterase
MLGSVSVWDTDFARFFSSKETIKTGIHPMEPYQPGRVPVIFVHGTVSSPLWWGEMLNTLYSDPVLRERCQFWLYAYNTGLPVAISAATFREAVSNYVQRLDPEGKDPTLRQIVVVGHSQGGLLAKLAVTSPGDKLWRAVSDRNLDEVTLKPEQREWLRRALFFNAVPAITRVVFICTPHRGSYRATSFVRRLAARLVTLPSRFVMTTQDALTLKKELRLPAEYHLSSPTSLEGMSPKNPVLLAMAEIPPVPGVTAHSIIAAKDPGKVPEANDGIVEYSSAHVPYVESELIVRSGHTAQDKSPTIEEIRRILLEHLRSLSAKNP